jgi:hypothetical protein
VGDAQNNNLNGGAGNDILLGIGGHDTLNGGGGYDILVAGTGTATFVAQQNAILVGGYTTYDTAAIAGTYTAYQAILAEWSLTTASVTTRWACINGTQTGLNGSYRLIDPTTVTNNGGADTVIGSLDSTSRSLDLS